MFHGFLTLIDVGKMCSVIKCDPLDLLNVIEEWLHRHVLCFIFCTIDQKSRSLNLAQQWDARPVAQRASNLKFVGAIPSICY